MIIETTEYNIKLVTIFIKWYFFEIPAKILKQLYKYLIAISKIYSFLFLLKTFFSPWKNQAYSYPAKGFDINKMLEVLTSNMVSRLVGAFVRLFTILTGIFVLILTVIVSIIALFIWVTYPVLFIVLIIRSF
ncbi:MAG: hypothetical protein WD512_10300 [Candidatus Paceibacterota bacterium]